MLIVMLIVILVLLISLIMILISVFSEKQYKKYKSDEWVRTSDYVVIEYEEYLGKASLTYFYKIKNINTDEWIYIYTYNVMDPSYGYSNVYKNKKINTNPIKEWAVEKIIISSQIKYDEKYKINYVTDIEITESDKIDDCVKNLKNEIEVNYIE